MSQPASDSLLWIKNELDHTLARARQALEAHVERPGNAEALDQCLDLLHQVQGTLRIVEVYGAAMLAEEMESVVRGIKSGEVQRSDAAFEVLVRAMLQLPDYLERVIGGRRDMPLALLSLLNDLRTVRGQPLLSESALFAYNLAGRSASVVGHSAVARSVDIRSLAVKLRPKFQMALLGWYKGDKAEQHLTAMAEAAEKLEQAATTPAVFELWWIVGGVIEGLREGGIQADVSLKQLLGQVDRQIKRLIDRGEAPLTEDPAKELVNNLLYYIGRATNKGQRIGAIKESFKLGELLPAAGEVESAREQIAAPNLQLMRTVSSAVKEDITRIKDTLDIFVRMGKSGVAELGPLDPLMKKVADTLGVLGLGRLRESLELERVNLKKVLGGQRVADEATLMEIASGIVSVEGRLEAAMLGLVAPAPSGKAADESRSERSELQDVQNAVIRESIINLARIKEAIVEYVNDPAKSKSLQPLPARIREIQASLRFLQLERMAVVLESVRQYIGRRLLAQSAAPGQNELDCMADAIVSVEFYLEAIQLGRGNLVAMLDNAEACVTALGFPVGRMYEDDIPPPAGAVQAESTSVESSVMEADSIVIEPVRTVAIESVVIPPAEAPALAPELEAQAPGSRSAQPSAAGPAVVPLGEVDPEILQIFLEEAQEEMQTLRDNFPRWRSNPADREALTTVRRSFHTLKGSGRMVGARLIGEFAWSFENMLNRVIEQTIEPSDDMYRLLERGIAALPELVAQLEFGSAPRSDIAPLMDTATAFSRGERPELPPVAPPAGAAPAKSAAPAHPRRPAASAVVEPPAATPADARLQSIFARESEGHLAVFAAFLERAQADAEQRVPDEDVVRGMHTLHGSASMAGVTGLATMIEPVQHYLMDMSAHDSAVPESGLKVLDEVLEAAHRMLATFNAGSKVPAADAALLKRVVAALQPPAPAGARAAPRKRERAMHVEKPRYVQLSELKDYDPDLAAIFFEEASELLEATDGTLHQWTQKPGDPELVMQLQRNLHTIKGGARMAGLAPMGDLSHELETVLTGVVDGRIPVSTEYMALLNRAVDRLHRMLEQSYANKPMLDAGDLVAELRQVHGDHADAEPEPRKAATQREPVPTPAAEPEDVSAAEAALGGDSDRRGGSRIQHELVRVRADLLENALNYSGEVGIYRSRLEQQVHSINFNLAELEQTVVRLRDQLRKLEIETEAQILYQFQQEGGDRDHPEFDPLELDRYSLLQQLSRALGESTGDLVSLQGLLRNQAREAETLLLQQSRVTTELQDGLMRTRMVPFSRHAQRLRRVVRQTADESGKQAEIRFQGAEGEMDRQVLERILAPLEHMLRNSVVHGIEKPELRRQHHKPAAGTVTIALSREGSEVVIEVYDDGAGLDLRAIRAKAEELGMVARGAKPSERDIMNYILEPGFSTAAKVTQTAGRGVGMDVVANEIQQLGGALRIDSTPGKGARFTIRLPFTLSITQALLVTMAEQPYAIPLPSIEGIARIPRPELERLLANEAPVYTYGGRHYQLQHLSVLLGIGAPQFPDELTTVPLLLVRTGNANLALITEGMQGSREVVVKSVGPQVSSIRGLSGASILGDGSIVLILDVTALSRRLTQAAELQEREPPKADTRIFAMVVDDSITVRRVTQRLLERFDMRVLTAKDGVDALALLQENHPDVMLLDIEMPRMDGYELAQHMRNDERFKDVPIIMITSRTGEKHRNRALEIGVNKYLGKPFKENELLETIQALVGRLRPQHGRRE
ncbi:MAG TPA: Hpt domain-containing protein [Gammaproteobacteria bacterium]|nr:Hpt domain-containing protein [Gammaproteobacteria bacterium]